MGVVEVSSAALKLARDFAKTIGNVGYGSQIVTFDWAVSMIVRDGPGLPTRDLGACLLIGAYRRDQVPPGCIDLADGFAFAIRIPEHVVDASALRRIDIDNHAPFGLTLR